MSEVDDFQLQESQKAMDCSPEFIVVVFNVSPTAKVISRWGHGLKSHPTDW